MVEIMTEKGEREVRLCDVWTLETYFPRIIKHLCVNHNSDLHARVWYKKELINLDQVCVWPHPQVSITVDSFVNKDTLFTIMFVKRHGKI